MGIAEARPDYLFRMVIIYLGLNAYNALAVSGRINIMAWVGTRVITTLRNELFVHLQELPLNFHSEHEVGRLMSRLTTDINRLRGPVILVGDLFDQRLCHPHRHDRHHVPDECHGSR